MRFIICILFIALWLYVLRLLAKSELNYWFFLAGSLGLFIFLMVFIRPVLTEPLAKAVSALAGVFGALTGTFSTYFKYGILFVNSSQGAITLQIDFECSGIIEIIAFLSLLIFFKVYNINERIVVGILGTACIMFANVLRIIIICEMIYFMGPGVYTIAHTLIGRVVFYALSVILYFYVFTKPHIIRMKVGRFTYGSRK